MMFNKVMPEKMLNDEEFLAITVKGKLLGYDVRYGFSEWLEKLLKTYRDFLQGFSIVGCRVSPPPFRGVGYSLDQSPYIGLRQLANFLVDELGESPFEAWITRLYGIANTLQAGFLSKAGIEPNDSREANSQDGLEGNLQRFLVYWGEALSIRDRAQSLAREAWELEKKSNELLKEAVQSLEKGLRK